MVLGLVFFKKLTFAQQLQHKSNVRRHNSYNPVSLGACTPAASLYSHPSCHLFTAILTHGLKLAQECLPVLKSYIQFPAHRPPQFVIHHPMHASPLNQRHCLFLYKPNVVATVASRASSCRDDHDIPKQALTVTLQFNLPLLPYLWCQLPW